MVLPPADTDTATWLEYNAALSRMDGDARLRAALDLSEGVREIRRGGAPCPEVSLAAFIQTVAAIPENADVPGQGAVVVVEPKRPPGGAQPTFCATAGARSHRPGEI